MTHLIRAILHLPLLTFVAGTLACGDNESPPTEDHVPESFEVLVNDVPEDPPFTLASGEQVRLRLKFFNAAGDDLDEVKDSHFAGLTFDPASLASAVRVPDEHYQFDVTGGTPGAGTVTVSFGHSEDADEHTLPPVPLTVTGP